MRLPKTYISTPELKSLCQILDQGKRKFVQKDNLEPVLGLVRQKDSQKLLKQPILDLFWTLLVTFGLLVTMRPVCPA
jgi:hypothetical protein